MPRVWLRRGGIIAGILFFGSITSFWNVVITYLLTSALSKDSVEDAVTFPTFDEKDDDDSIDSSVVQQQYTQHAQHVQHVYTETYTLPSANTSTRHPRIINVDGAAITIFTPDEKRKERKIYIDRHTLKAWRQVEDDTNYPITEEAFPEECIQMSSWQSDSYPNCNFIHDMDLYTKLLSDDYRYIASGGFNDVFRISHNKRYSLDGLDSEALALKVLSPGKKHRAKIPNKLEYSEKHFDIVRQDALVLERLTKSSNVLPLYGYCGFTVAIPWSTGGTLASRLSSSSEWSKGKKAWKNITSTTRLKYAVDAANALAEIHDLGVVHADLTINQYLIDQHETLQLGDFNRGIYLRENITAPGSECTFLMTENYGTTRAPEEYMHKPQTKAVDIWSLGSILYHLLTGNKVWGQTKKNRAQEAVALGKLPEIDQTILNSADPVDKILKQALDMCYVYDANKRSTAREVASFLQQGLEALS